LNFNIESYIKNCPLNLSGADFYSITNKARQHALKRLIMLIENNQENKTLENQMIVLNEQDFNNALIDFKPTLNEQALLEYEKFFISFSNKQ
jgi:peroxin-6